MTKLPDRDDPDVNPMDVLDVTENFLQDLLEKRQNAMDVQASAAIRAILSGESPTEVAHRCGFKEPDRGPQTPDQMLRMMMGVRDQPDLTATANFARWLTHWLFHQIVGGAEDCDGGA